MKRHLPLIFSFLSGMLCADLVLHAFCLLTAWRAGGLVGILGFLVKQGGLWLGASLLLCAATLMISLITPTAGKAKNIFLALALLAGAVEGSLFHLRIFPGKTGVYAFFIGTPLFFLFRSVGAVLCVKNAYSVFKKNQTPL